MFRKPLVFALILTFSALANAHNYHTKNYCSNYDQTICAHIGYDEEFSTQKEAEFMVDVVSPKAERMKNIQIELWMDMGSGHGHGSAPVQWTDEGSGKYHVTNAYFVMAGEWQIKVAFDIEGVAQEIIIPVPVQQ